MKVVIASAGQPIGGAGEVLCPAFFDKLIETFPPGGVPVANPSPGHEDPPSIGWATSIERVGDDFVAEVEFSKDFLGPLEESARHRPTQLPTFSFSVLLGRDPVTGEKQPRVLDLSPVHAAARRAIG